MTGRRALFLLLITLVILVCASAKRRKRCKYNKKRYMAGALISAKEDNCVELRCLDGGKMMNLTVMEGCTCFKEETKTCNWNGKMIAVGEVAYESLMNCVELKCVEMDNKMMLSYEQIDGCTFPMPTTPAPTTPMPRCRYKKKFGKQHTMVLKRNKKCKFHHYGVTEEEKQTILKTHNDLRTKVAKGKEKRGTQGPQPKAANMREIVWNDQLAEVAQAWADQCDFNPDLMKNRMICSRSYMVGQNIFFYDYSKKHSKMTNEQIWMKAIMNWYDEVVNMPKTIVSSFTYPETGLIPNQYTQVVWAKTHEIGCGYTYFSTVIVGIKYPHSKIYVCNYGPGGNVMQEPVYEIGRAASNCEYGMSTNYPLLCA